jgi:hypothetical protein
METIQDKVARMMMRFTFTGSALGFIAFLLVGAIPGLLYGGYLGLMMTGALFGVPVKATILAKIITGGGMLLGLLATLFFFLVLGAIAGTATALFFRPILFIIASRHTEETGPTMQTTNPPPGPLVSELKQSLNKKTEKPKKCFFEESA